MTANIGRDIPSSQLNLPLGFSFYFLRDSHSPDDVAGLQSVRKEIVKVPSRPDSVFLVFVSKSEYIPPIQALQRCGFVSFSSERMVMNNNKFKSLNGLCLYSLTEPQTNDVKASSDKSLLVNR